MRSQPVPQGRQGELQSLLYYLGILMAHGFLFCLSLF